MKSKYAWGSGNNNSRKPALKNLINIIYVLNIN